MALVGTSIANYFADGVVPSPLTSPTRWWCRTRRSTRRLRTSRSRWPAKNLADLLPDHRLPGLLDDPRYKATIVRMQMRDSLVPWLQEIFMTRRFKEWEVLAARNEIAVRRDQ